jgi:hypothetical protein
VPGPWARPCGHRPLIEDANDRGRGRPQQGWLRWRKATSGEGRARMGGNDYGSDVRSLEVPRVTRHRAAVTSNEASMTSRRAHPPSTPVSLAGGAPRRNRTGDPPRPWGRDSLRRQARAESWLHRVRRPLPIPIPLAPDLGVTPGQLNRRTLNQRWKVRMLAGWEPQHAPMRTQTRWSPARPSAWHPPTPRLVVTAMQAAARADAAMHGSCPAGESRPGYARRADAEFCYSTPPDLRRRPAQHARRVRSQAWPDPACTTNTSLPVPVSIV